MKPLAIPVRVETHRGAGSTFDARLETLAVPLRALDEAGVRAVFELESADLLIKTTLSLCPECLSHVPAAVLQRGRQVWLRKRCPLHGCSAAVIENDVDFYRISSKDRWGRAYSGIAQDVPAFSGNACCGPGQSCAPATATADAPHDFSDQSLNKTCTVLVEITDACNLTLACLLFRFKG